MPRIVVSRRRLHIGPGESLCAPAVLLPWEYTPTRIDAVLDRLGRAAARWRFAILAVWAVLAVVGGVFGAGVYDRTETVDDARGQSARAQERLDELDPEGELVVAIISGKDYFARDLVDAVPPIMYALRELPG